MKPVRKTREISLGSIKIGGGSPIAVQSMCATKTTDIEATLSQIRMLESVGADLIRVAVDSRQEVEALKVIRQQTVANLVVDLQENFSLACSIAPYVQKLRYNPGHLHHHKRNLSVRDKVAEIVQAAGSNGCAMRIGVNFGSIDPKLRESHQDPRDLALLSAMEHCDMLEREGFKNYCVSLKSSDPYAVININRRFSSMKSEIPLHLGVTEAGLLPDGEVKTRIAFEDLISSGIGDTIRVSLTLPDDKKHLEISIGRKILSDISSGIFRSREVVEESKLNIISCPSCSRVENRAFVALAQKVKDATCQYRNNKLTIAVMGCRVNGPGETDDADFGLWCAPNHVNLKRGKDLLGQFSYDDVVNVLLSELAKLPT